MSQQEDIEQDDNEIEPEELSELEEAQQKAEDNMNGWMRSKADYANREKEHERQMAVLRDMVTSQCLQTLLPSYTALERACEHIPEGIDDAWVQGLQQTEKSFQDAMEKLGVRKMDVVGTKLDPMRHEVIAKRAEEGAETDVIVEEVASGYLINDNVLLPAKVIVAE